MKRLIALLLSLSLVTGLCACGASAPQETIPATQETVAEIVPEQLVEEAKNKIAKYEGTLNIHLVIIEELLQLPEDAAEDPVIAAFMLEIAQQTFALIAEEMEGIYNPDKIMGYMEQLVPITKLSGEALNPEQAKEKADLILNVGDFYLERELPEEAMNYWKECKDPTVDVILEAMDLFRQGKNVQAIEWMREKLENSEDYEWFAFRRAACTLTDDIQDELDYWKAYSMAKKFEMTPEETWIDEITEYWYGRTYETFGGFTEENIRYLKENAGKEAAGKVLILQKNRAFGAETAGLRISSRLQELPEELIPASVEEIEYILLLDVDYTEEGKFPVGTALIKEIASLYAYSVHQSEPIYQSPERETAIFMNVTMTYNGDPPAFYAPNHPDMTEYAKEALHLIMDNINNQ